MSTQRLEQLKKIVPGMVALPGEERYTQASQLFKRTLAPRVVVRPESTADMSSVVRFLNEVGLPIVTKSGGHSNIPYEIGDDIALIDLSALSSIEVIDKEKGLVRFGTGALAGTVADELDRYGLGLASGDSRVVGMGGLVTGGGLGFLVRKYGALVDSIISMEVVVADGSVIEATKDHHADLFWAVRGGGSNFGIVTHVVCQAHPVKEVFEMTCKYPISNAAKIIKGWRNVMRQAPAELSTVLTVLPARDDAAASILIHGCFLGDNEAAAKKACAPLLTLGESIDAVMHLTLYKDMLEAGPPRATSRRSIARNAFFRTFTDDVIDAIAELCATGTPPVLQIRHVAGAMNSYPVDMTAFSHRDSEVLIYHGTSVPFEATDQDVNAALAAWRTIERLGTGSYMNMTSEVTQAEIARTYPPQALQRLQAIKNRYDPNNYFHVNFNVQPSSV